MFGQVIDCIQPIEDEIVIPKTSSSVFQSTNLDYILRCMGKKFLVFCGCLTDQCVDHAVRDACDLGYRVTLIAGEQQQFIGRFQQFVIFQWLYSSIAMSLRGFKYPSTLLHYSDCFVLFITHFLEFCTFYVQGTLQHDLASVKRVDHRHVGYSIRNINR